MPKTALFKLSAPFVLGFLLLGVMGFVFSELLMGISSFMHGENLWAKNQKNAVVQLQRYLVTADADALARHDEAMRVYGVFRSARDLMVAEPAERAHKMQLCGMSPVPLEDCARIFRVHHHFHWSSMVVTLMTLWADADVTMDELAKVRSKIEAAVRRGDRPLDAHPELIDVIYRLDVQADHAERAFSAQLNGLRYWVFGILLTTTALLIAILLVLSVLRTQRYVHSRERIEMRLRSERERAETTLAMLGEAVLTADRDGKVIYMNPAAQVLTQCMADSMGTPLHLPDVLRFVEHSPSSSFIRSHWNAPIISPPDPKGLLHWLLETKPSQLRSDDSFRLERADGRQVPVTWNATPLGAGPDGDADGMVLVLHDNTREHELVERLTWLAAHDSLTQLPNRREFEAQLVQAIASVSRDDNRQGHQPMRHVLMMIDLDQFKIVNDTCGHVAGDELLCQVSSRVSEHLGPNDLLARLGGDEFGVLATDCSVQRGKQLASELLQVIATTELRWGLRSFRTTASIGVVHLDGEITNMGDLLSAVDLACYKAKDNGRNQYAVYSAQDAELTTRYGEMNWVQRLQTAIKEDRFFLQAQTIQALQVERPAPAHCELLLRLRDEEGTVVPPGMFIPAAERYGLMPLIDRWVVQHALAHIADLRQMGASGQDVQHGVFSINLSGPTFSAPGFVEDLKRWFVDYDVSYAAVCFELTETAAVANFGDAIAFITELRGLGCTFALDDFGAGLSSFNYLKHIPADYLKIDGALVKNMVNSSVDRAMVEMIHRLGQTMGMRTIGEFAENAEIIEALRAAGVDYAQGYGVARPDDWLV